MKTILMPLIGGPQDGGMVEVRDPPPIWYQVLTKVTCEADPFDVGDTISTYSRAVKHCYDKQLLAVPIGECTWYYLFYVSHGYNWEQQNMYTLPVGKGPVVRILRTPWNVESERRKCTFERAHVWLNYCRKHSIEPDEQLLLTCACDPSARL